MSLWDSPRQREAYDWFAVELANLRTAFRWAADRGDLDDAATIATYAAFLGFCIDNYEPIAWAEELIEPARAVDHPRLAFLYVIASQCYTSGRVEEAVRYSEAGMAVVESGRGEVPFGIDGLLSIAYLYAGQPEQAVDWCRSRVQSGRDTHTVSRTSLIPSLTVAQSYEDAIAATTGLIEAAEATRNPWALSFALFGFGAAFRTCRSGRCSQGHSPRAAGCRRQRQPLASGHTWRSLVARIEAEYGDSLRALHYIAVRSTITTTRVTQRRCEHRWLPSLRFLTGWDATNPQPPSPVSRQLPSPWRRYPELRHHHSPPTHCSRRPGLRITCPQG